MKVELNGTNHMVESKHYEVGFCYIKEFELFCHVVYTNYFLASV